MAYNIHAWLDHDGHPHLELVDTESGRVRLDWAARESSSPALKSLFHKLMLVSVRERLKRHGDAAPRH